MVCSGAHAQTASFVDKDKGMDVHLFRPAVDSKGFIGVDGTSILGEKDYSFGLVLDMGLGIFPFSGFNYDRGSRSVAKAEKTDHLVDTAITGTLHFNYGIANTAVVGVQVPIMVVNGPNLILPGIYNNSSAPVGTDSQGFGNITLHGKLRLLRSESEPIGLAAILHVELPTGNAAELRGDPGFVLWPVLALEWVPVPRLRFGLNVGYRFNTGSSVTMPYDGSIAPVTNYNNRASALLFPTDICVYNPNSMPTPNQVSNPSCPGNIKGGHPIQYDDMLTFGAAASWRFVPSAELVGEFYGNQVAKSFGKTGSLGAEAIGGLKIYVEANSYLVLAGGAGVLQSLNSADIRAVLGFIFEPSIGDRDGDGYKDDVDECPDDPEDFDHFQDEDGCPEPDNDRDGILDVDDECPLVPEDHDGDADEDGCPEGSIGDRDGDGILDNVDKCPDDPEDRDGFEDEDGCPDPDNDKDGILDVNDLCPMDPEDKDNFEDQDGCPDEDNDKDRILDRDDACPNNPETYNGYQDEDGCPDKGSVIIEENEIIILEKIYFATDSAQILEKSFPIVDAVAATLIGNPQITLVEIQGHADERGDDNYNIRLTADRAASVRQALIQRGVDAARLRSAGYGERCPVDPQHNAPAWEKNRRVEFKIIRTDQGPTGVEVACPAGKDLVPKD
ncbi:MAG TPA: OmpA family protein [Polyangiales bacterium]|nr:OmpA family protein [Polyangiales bacterium]